MTSRLVRYTLATLAAVALLGVIALTAIEAGSRMQDLRGGTAGAAPQGGIEELAQRLLTPAFPMPDGSQQTVALDPGALPKNAPFDLPLPPSARLVGSVTRERTSGSSTLVSFDVVLDVPGPPDDVTAFYDREMPKKGMDPLSRPLMPQQGGFVSSVGPTSTKMYCKSDQGPAPYVSLTVFSKPGAPNDVRVHYEPASPQMMGSPCRQEQGGPQPYPTKLPTLHAPQGVTLQPNGGQGDGNKQTSDATAITSTSVADLESAFAQQLSAAGWTRLAGKADGPLAWSTWKIPGEGDWQGLLLVVQAPGTDRRSLTVRAEAAGF
ncbi:MAG: hypothetical protein KGN00_12735 [Chloroflexota bacterium]|nr:hypothetical protein [Chloroflexota bacterium]MDE3194539.1 hypothetical protein [Chloroflexota bacterium]